MIQQTCVCVQSLGCVRLFVTLWTVAHQASLPWDFSGKDTGVVTISFSRGLSPPRTEPASPVSPALQMDSLLRILYQGSLIQ